MASDAAGFPAGSAHEKELLLQWLRYLRGAVLRNLEGVNDSQSRWTPDGHLIPLIGIVNHLAGVEWRWIDGGFGDADVSRSEEEFHPGDDTSVDLVTDRYRRRADATDAAVASLALTHTSDPASWAEGKDLRWVVLHLINETARHAGHADAVRELLDGMTGE
ncbi:MAG: DUF664 domain-containing protein [Acidimicrobiales bacterium]